MSSLIRLITLTAVFVWLTPGLQGQDEKVDIDKLPAKVAATLKARFPGAQITTVTKAIENGEVIYDIEMTRRGKKHEMDVKEDGVIVNFENQITVNALPAAVAAAVKARYPKCTIKEAMEVMVIKGHKDVVDEYEVLIETVEKKELELTVSPDGKKIE
jgi:Putative beta-lactamase-inhibitor-like, PepSY-like